MSDWDTIRTFQAVSGHSGSGSAIPDFSHMSQLLQSLQQLLLRQITERGIVVWYDPERAYAKVVDRLALEGVKSFKYEDGYFRLREQLEAWMEWVDESGRAMPDHEVPPKILVYVPHARNDSHYALIEAETAGVVIEPGAPVAERNSRLAGLVERLYARLSPEKAGHVARQVEDGLLNFEDVEQMSEETGSNATGALKLIFGQASPVDLLLLFAASEEHDARIQEKNALGELANLMEQELGLTTKATGTPAMLRASLVRHLLLGELALALPESLRDKLPQSGDLPDKAVQRDTIRHLCQTWRNRMDLQEAYATAAEDFERTTGLANLGLPAEGIETLETFSFIDSLVLVNAGEALLSGNPARAAAYAEGRRSTFWNRRYPEIILQWSLVETAASLLTEADTISKELRKRKWSLDEMVNAYVHHASPWMRLDTLARHLESRYARFDFERAPHSPDWEKVMARCRAAYLACLDLMTEAYTKAIEAAGFHSRQVPAQSRVFHDRVAPLLKDGKKAAYVLVDALRYEMAADLLDGLGREFGFELTPALGQLPGITPIGMASLMPGAEDGLSLEKSAGKLHVTAGGKRITDRASRMAWLESRVGEGTVVVKLGDIARLTPKKRKDLGAARFLVVTSQEIDRIGEGEGEDDEARIYMDEVLEKLRRGLRNLASIGFTEIIVSADHGFIFAEGFETGLKMDPPGGDTVELHPRCWIGQGGNAASGYFRVPASGLELGGALECAFPRGLGTFKVKGGASAYFHGGASLQEQLIPVLHLTRRSRASEKAGACRWSITFNKKMITNRFFSVVISMESDEIFVPEPKSVRVEMVSGKDLVGHAAIASYGFEESTREVLVECGKPNAVTMMITAGNLPEQVDLRVIDGRNESQLAEISKVKINLAL